MFLLLFCWGVAGFQHHLPIPRARLKSPHDGPQIGSSVAEAVNVDSSVRCYNVECLVRTSMPAATAVIVATQPPPSGERSSAVWCFRGRRCILVDCSFPSALNVFRVQSRAAVASEIQQRISNVAA